jgi:hypothetical protein
VTFEVAQNAPDIVFGMFPVNTINAIVLFDSGASHSCISKRFASKNQFSFLPLQNSMVIQSPGSKQNTQWYCKDVNIEIKGMKFLASLIVLEAVVLDVILGMDWLTTNKGFIDCYNRTVTLTNYQGITIKFGTRRISTSHGKLNQVDMAELSKVPVVCEYPDVFPEELPDMPPDREFEFVIVLAPGMAPIYKKPYRMAPTELVELKKQINELLEKDLSDLACHHGDHRSYSPRKRMVP